MQYTCIFTFKMTCYESFLSLFFITWTNHQTPFYRSFPLFIQNGWFHWLTPFWICWIKLEKFSLNFSSFNWNVAHAQFMTMSLQWRTKCIHNGCHLCNKISHRFCSPQWEALMWLFDLAANHKFVHKFFILHIVRSQSCFIIAV